MKWNHNLAPALLVFILIVTACAKPTTTKTSDNPIAQPTLERTASEPKPANAAPTEVKKQANEVPKTTHAAPAKKRPATDQARTTSPAPSAAAETLPEPAAVVAEQPIQPALEPPLVNQNVVVPPAATVQKVTIAAGTVISIRTIESIDSRTDQAGQTFRATLDAAVTVDGQLVVPKGARADLKLVRATSAGNIRGRSELQLELERIVIGTQSYAVESNVVEQVGEAQGPKTARDTAIGAAIGAVIGAIAGGGKGAAIGAGTGAGAGVAIAAITKGEQVLVPSETRLDFRLEQPLTIDVETPTVSSSNVVPGGGPRRLGEDSTSPPPAGNKTLRSLTGEWTLRTEGPKGVRTQRLSLQQDGRLLKGTIADLGRGSLLIRGTVDGDSVQLWTEFTIRGATLRSEYSGTIAGTRLQGTMTVRAIGSAVRPRLGRAPYPSRTFSWNATRVEL